MMNQQQKGTNLFTCRRLICMHNSQQNINHDGDSAGVNHKSCHSRKWSDYSILIFTRVVGVKCTISYNKNKQGIHSGINDKPQFETTYSIL